MNRFEKILYMLQGEMEEPTRLGWFHLIWIFLIIITLVFLSRWKSKNKEKQLKIVLGVYGIIALILEITKQLIWSFEYNPTTNLVTWDYQWYAAPFQLCTTPIFVTILCLFLKNGKFKNSLLSYMAFVTILGSITTIIYPDSCFVSDILVNIHTMWLHCGSFVVSVYLLISNNVELNKQNLKSALKVFLVFVLLAEMLNMTVYHMGVLENEEFNMFYISPYFISSLPVFNIIQQNVPFIIYLLLYILAISIGATCIYGIAIFIQNRISKKKQMVSKSDATTEEAIRETEEMVKIE